MQSCPGQCPDPMLVKLYSAASLFLGVTKSNLGVPTVQRMKFHEAHHVIKFLPNEPRNVIMDPFLTDSVGQLWIILSLI